MKLYNTKKIVIDEPDLKWDATGLGLDRAIDMKSRVTNHSDKELGTVTMVVGFIDADTNKVLWTEMLPVDVKCPPKESRPFNAIKDYFGEFDDPVDNPFQGIENVRTEYKIIRIDVFDP